MPNLLRVFYAALVTGIALSGCGGGDGATQAPSPPPNVSASVDHTSVTAGASVTVTWSSTNATTCTASGGWSGALALSGSQAVGPLNQTTTLSVSCTGPGGTSSTSPFTITVTTPPAYHYSFSVSEDAVNDAAWDSARQVLYLAIGSTGPVDPNSIVVFDPVRGTINNAVFAGSEPNAIGISDDGQYLYVGFAGNDSIRRFHLPDLTADISFAVDPEVRALHGDPLFANQIAVAPGAPHTVAVARINPRRLPHEDYFLVFEDAAYRTPANGTYGYPATSLSWGLDATALYAGTYNSAAVALYTTSSGTITQNVQVLDTSAPATLTTNTIQYANGSVYNSAGSVFTPGLAPSGSYGTRGIVTVDVPNSTVFFATSDDVGNLMISAYNQGNYTLKDATITSGNGAIKVGPPRRVIRWGTDGLAVVGAFGRLAIIWGPLVAPGGTATPVGTIPGAAVGCCGGLGKEINANTTPLAIKPADIAWDATHGILLASIPASASDHPQNIAAIDPSTGQATLYAPTAGDPGVLAVSDDGQYLYVAVPGGFQRFQLPALTPDLSVAVNGMGTGTPTELEVAPGAPHTVAVETLIYDDAVWRAIPSVQASWVEWGADATTLFGLQSASTGMTLTQATVSNTNATLTPLGAPLTYPWDPNNDYPFNITFRFAGGLIYGDTGAVFDPATGAIVGTLPLTSASGAELQGLGTLAIDTQHRRAYVAVCIIGSAGVCNNDLISFDLDTYLPVSIAPLRNVTGWTTRLEEINNTLFAVRAPDGTLYLVSSPDLAR